MCPFCFASCLLTRWELFEPVWSQRGFRNYERFYKGGGTEWTVMQPLCLSRIADRGTCPFGTTYGLVSAPSVFREFCSVERRVSAGSDLRTVWSENHKQGSDWRIYALMAFLHVVWRVSDLLSGRLAGVWLIHFHGREEGQKLGHVSV